jgi:hypothetical protein
VEAQEEKIRKKTGTNGLASMMAALQRRKEALRKAEQEMQGKSSLSNGLLGMYSQQSYIDIELREWYTISHIHTDQIAS